MNGLLGLFGPGYGQMLSPEEQQQAMQSGLLNIGLRMLANSGPSPNKQSLGQIIGQSGLGMLHDQQRGLQGLLQNKYLKTRIDEAEMDKRRSQSLSGLLGQRGETETPIPGLTGEDGKPFTDYPRFDKEGTGYVGGKLTTPEFYANVAALGGDYTKMGLAGLMGQSKEGFTLGPGQTRFDASGRPVATGGVDPEQKRKRFTDANTLRDEYVNLTKDFRQVNDAYGRIVAAAENPSAAGDLALLTGYMKLIDPTTGVKEGEFANASNAAGVPEQVRNFYNRLVSGERMSDSMRADFSGQAKNLYTSHERTYEGIRGQYKTLAERNQLDPNDVLPEFRAPRKETSRTGGLSSAEQLELERLRKKFNR